MRNSAPSDVIKTLSGIPLFNGCSRRELEQIARLGTIVDVADGAELTVQGHAGREFVLVMKGRARCIIDGSPVKEFDAGDFFGELALLDGGPRTATVVAKGEVQALVLDPREFHELIDLGSPVSKNMLVELARRYRATAVDLPSGADDAVDHDDQLAVGK